MPFLVQIEQLHSPTVDCSRSTRMRNRTRPQWQPPSYVCSISLLPCRSTLFRLSFWGSSAHTPAYDKRSLHNQIVQNSEFKNFDKILAPMISRAYICRKIWSKLTPKNGSS